ncbi:MAG: alpha/beta hydrolase [Chloroflexi bacterium]|nr:alpha/beta hydrolase [Chloroflexota bacterium]
MNTSTVEVNYAEGPDNGPPVVLIHGIGGWWKDWESVIEQLSVRWHVYAIDLRGHGDSGRTSGSYDFIDYPSEVIEFLRDVVRTPAYLVGHSLGGVTAASVCARNPELVAAAVLEDPPLYIREWFEESPSSSRFKQLFEIRSKNLDIRGTAGELRKMNDTMSDAALLASAKKVLKVDPGVWGAAIGARMTDTWDPDAVLGSVSSPVLLVQANPDMHGVLRDVEATRTINLLAQGRHVKWDDSGHLMHASHPERFSQLVDAYFSQVLRDR